MRFFFIIFTPFFSFFPACAIFRHFISIFFPFISSFSAAMIFVFLILSRFHSFLSRIMIFDSRCHYFRHFLSFYFTPDFAAITPPLSLSPGLYYFILLFLSSPRFQILFFRFHSSLIFRLFFI